MTDTDDFDRPEPIQSIADAHRLNLSAMPRVEEALTAAFEAGRRTPALVSGELREIVARAYQAGCYAVHEQWVRDGTDSPNEPDFWEAASDYADSQALAPLIAAREAAAVERERAAVVAYISEQYCLNDDCRLDMLAAIERNEHGGGNG